MTTAITPLPTPPSLSDPATFDPRMDALLNALPTFVDEANLYEAVLAAAAGPGGIFITYTFDGASASVADPGAGKLRLDNLTQGSATAALADNADNLGVSATGRLARLTSTSDLEGYILAYKVGDPTKWLMGGVSANTAASGYYNLTLTSVEVSTADPFTDGDSLVLILVPKGDKGDTGPPSSDTLLSTTTISGSPSLVTLSGYATTYSDLVVELDAVTMTSNPAVNLLLSADGTTFSTGVELLPAGSTPSINGVIDIRGYRRALQRVSAVIGVANPTSPALATPQSTPATGWYARITGGVAAIRLSLSVGSFTGGTIRLYGKN